MTPVSLGKLDKSELITLFLALNARVAALEAQLIIPPKDAGQLLASTFGRPESQSSRRAQAFARMQAGRDARAQPQSRSCA